MWGRCAVLRALNGGGNRGMALFHSVLVKRKVAQKSEIELQTSQKQIIITIWINWHQPQPNTQSTRFSAKIRDRSSPKWTFDEFS